MDILPTVPTPELGNLCLLITVENPLNLCIEVVRTLELCLKVESPLNLCLEVEVCNDCQ